MTENLTRQIYLYADDAKVFFVILLYFYVITFALFMQYSIMHGNILILC